MDRDDISSTKHRKRMTAFIDELLIIDHIYSTGAAVTIEACWCSLRISMKAFLQKVTEITLQLHGTNFTLSKSSQHYLDSTFKKQSTQSA